MSFRLYIASIFISIISLLSAALIYVSLQHSQDISTSLSKDIVTNYAKELTVKIEKVTGPLSSLLNTLAMGQFTSRDIGKPDPAWLNAMTAILEKNQYLDSMYFGKEDGTAFLFQPLYDDKIKKTLSAPSDARLMVRYYKVGSQRIQFYDVDMNLMSEKNIESDYDPRERAWYQDVDDANQIFMTGPYNFSNPVQDGITFSRKTRNGDAIIGVDLTLSKLTKLVQYFEFSSNSNIFLLNNQSQIIGSNQLFSLMIGENLFSAKDLAFDQLIKEFEAESKSQLTAKTVTWKGKTWELMITPLTLADDSMLRVVNFVSHDDLFATSSTLRNDLIIISIFSVIISFLIVLFIARRIASPLTYLTNSIENIQRFHFQRKNYQASHIQEIDKLNKAMGLMENVLLDFFHNLRNVARTSRPEELSESIVTQVKEILSADDCQLFTSSPDSRGEFKLSAKSGDTPEFNLQSLYDHNPNAFRQSIYELTTNEANHIFTDLQCHSGYIIPLFNRNNDNTGALLIGFTQDITDDTRNRLRFVREFIGFNEIVLEHLEKVDEQRALFHSFVEMTATAVDIKSPYTGGHCQRVPKITKMLAKAAEEDTDKFADFSLTSKSWEELLVAAWLHDCGKVTTPDYVMDKATKLETIYDRIHEIRMRYEVLKRDAEVTYWQSIATGMDEAQALKICDDLKDELDKEFEFIASCNPGSEFLDPEKQQRLAEIGERTWLRTLPDDIGVSQQEQLKKSLNKQSLPVTEKILADKPEHLFVWEEKKQLQANSKRDFKMVQPEYRYNRGELHNLMVKSGTLTPEERYNINDHIVQTYLMLDQLPYPEHLKNVPLIAGSHHEKMNGQGYPLQLKGEEIPIGGRMIAVADVFEALTANDRPYKAAKTLSHSLKIMAFMVKDEHLDGNVFDLFLTKGIYQEYADHFLTAEQIDHVDVESLRDIYL
ncbi:chemotaxis protein [Moritella sp. 24]|uniref:HD domain-containing phosphohydrolase n=1 Tax=Moritella sp. 24 TaxID=2746230 RepID=UPI001BAD02F8|nr:HD domain-containing phosphohydrolase [Moritella sp. 24]QUM76705.1 chemotaxis protein [Moritella sp. 24]